MYKPALLLMVFLAMVPVVYALFFTHIVDRAVTRLRIRGKTRSIAVAAADFESQAATAEKELTLVRAETDAAMAALDEAIGRWRPCADPDDAGWLIRSAADPNRYWSRAGWVTKSKAARFSGAEKATLTIPAHGKWARAPKLS